MEVTLVTGFIITNSELLEFWNTKSVRLDSQWLIYAERQSAQVGTIN
jgi:hypothetical protein